MGYQKGLAGADEGDEGDECHKHRKVPAIGGANRLFQLPRFGLQVAGFRRAPAQIKDLKKAI